MKNLENMVKLNSRRDKRKLLVLLKTYIRRNIRNIILISLILIFWSIFSILSPSFLSLESVMNIIRRINTLAIVSIGMTFVILTGGIDLSVGSNLALAGAVTAIVLNTTGNPLLGFLTALLVAGAVGLLNGFMIGKLKVNSIVLTLATMGMARSLTLVLTHGSTIRVNNGIFTWLGRTSINTSTSTIPVAGFLIIIIFLFFINVLRNTVFGRSIYAIGGNKNASKLAGISVEKNIVFVYLIAGLLVGIATILTVGRVSSAVPWAGLGLEFEAITVVILGGVSLAGGEGDLKGTFLGVILIGVLFGGLGMMEISPYIQYIVKGLLLLLAVLANRFSHKYLRTY